MVFGRLRWMLLAGLIFSVFAFFTRADSLSATQALLALLITWVGAFPGLWYFYQPADAPARSTLPLMAFTGAFYSVFFGVSSFLAFSLRGTGAAGPDDSRIAFYGQSYLTTVSVDAQLLVLSGVILLFSTWALTNRILARRLPRLRLPKAALSPALIPAAWVLAAGNLGYLSVAEIRAIPSVGQFLQPAGTVAFAIFYLLKIEGRLSLPHVFAYFLIVLPISVIHLLATGFLTPVISLVVIWLALRISKGGMLPWKIGISIFLLFVLAYPSVQFYRAAYWTDNATASATERAAGLFRIITRGALDSETGFMSGQFPHVRVVRRVSHILTFSHVVEVTPEQVPYWQGATYRTLLIGWVPRLLWRNKPQERWGNTFGRRYMILPPNEKSMSINIPWVTELYANFGKSGVILGMVLIGLFLGLFDRFLNAPNGNAAEKAIAAGLLLPLFYQESNFTLMTGSLLPQTLTMWLFFAVFLRLFGHSRSAGVQ